MFAVAAVCGPGFLASLGMTRKYAFSHMSFRAERGIPGEIAGASYAKLFSDEGRLRRNAVFMQGVEIKNRPLGRFAVFLN